MKTRTTNTVMEKNASKQGWLTKAGAFLNKHMAEIACVLFVCLMVSGVAGAAPDADQMWIAVVGAIQKWVNRLGAVVMLIGGIMFGLGWQRDDASAKSAGVTTMIAGGIVLTVVNLIGSFLL